MSPSYQILAHFRHWWPNKKPCSQGATTTYLRRSEADDDHPGLIYSAYFSRRAARTCVMTFGWRTRTWCVLRVSVGGKVDGAGRGRRARWANACPADRPTGKSQSGGQRGRLSPGLDGHHSVFEAGCDQPPVQRVGHEETDGERDGKDEPERGMSRGRQRPDRLPPRHAECDHSRHEAVHGDKLGQEGLPEAE